MRINVTSVLVEDQQKALDFYTGILGFVKKVDIPAGGARWLTVVSPDAPDGTELLLEPNSNPAVPAREWHKALYDAGIPATSFAVDDVVAEHARLSALGVQFVTDPATHEGVTTAIFDDTCGNLIMIVAT
jgi:catechol 2,3-dioxygenase-like lactoylglutathione lyase family enzyme